MRRALIPVLLTLALIPVACASSDDDGMADAGAELPDTDYCDPVLEWDEAAVDFENEVLALTNSRRAAGADCGSKGSFGPAGSLTMDPALRCAARVHSLDMDERGFFDHTNPDGESPWDRFDRAGYSWSAAGENIASGQTSPEQVVQGWMDSDGHCANIMNADFTELGVGYVAGGDFGHLWTQTFARPQ